VEKGKVIIRIKDEYELQGGIGKIDLYWSNTGMRLCNRVACCKQNPEFKDSKNQPEELKCKISRADPECGTAEDRRRTVSPAKPQAARMPPGAAWSTGWQAERWGGQAGASEKKTGTMKTRTQIHYNVRLARLFADRQAGVCDVKLSWVWLVLVIFLLALPAQAADPVLVGQWPGWQRGPACGVAVNGHYAYMALGNAGMAVIDVSNPAKPQRVGGCKTGGAAVGVAVSGNYVYVADGSAGLVVIDVSDPANPQLVGGHVTMLGAEGVAVSGKYAYVADGPLGLLVIDVSDPANPRCVGGCDTDGWASGVAVSGNYAYVADGSAGLQVIDV
jgi:hypothetical protein